MTHLSVGHFHRGHQAVYLDELAQRGHTAWGLTGVAMRGRAVVDALEPQDGLYTVVERGAGADRPRVIGVMSRCVSAPEDPTGVAAILADPRTRLVTLTVTGGGYQADPLAGALDAARMRAAGLRPLPPAPTALGLLVEGLDARRRARRAPFTVLSCDNLPANGEVAREAVLVAARNRDEHLARWIEEHVAFPSSMVDRIAPKTTGADRERLAREFGIQDRWPVMTEAFSDWVIEDQFCNDRPPLDEVGVRFVPDVRPYALAKTRMLNASHLVLGALGRLAGFTTMCEVMADPVLHAYADSLMATEIAPFLPPTRMDLDDYRRSLLVRLANPKLQDPVGRLCRGMSLKTPRLVVPSVLAARDELRPHPLLTLAVAGLCRHLRGVDDRGRRFELDDPQALRLRVLATAGGDDPRPLLSAPGLFGTLGADPEFVADVERALEALSRDGTRATVARALQGSDLVPA